MVTVVIGKRDLTRSTPIVRNVITGIWSPEDLLGLLRPGDAVVDLGGEGASHQEQVGLAACRALRAWVEHVGMSWVESPGPTWQEGRRIVAALPMPVSVYVAQSWLRGEADQPTSETEAGHLTALECYPEGSITGRFRVKGGETFRAVPLEAFRTRSGVDPEAGDPCALPEGERYYISDRQGIPAFDLLFPGSTGLCHVYGRDHARIDHQGRSLGILRWSESDQILHLVDLSGQFLLWPQHKLLFGSGAVLPE